MWSLGNLNVLTNPVSLTTACPQREAQGPQGKAAQPEGRWAEPWGVEQSHGCDPGQGGGTTVTGCQPWCPKEGPTPKTTSPEPLGPETWGGGGLTPPPAAPGGSGP